MDQVKFLLPLSGGITVIWIDLFHTDLYFMRGLLVTAPGLLTYKTLHRVFYSCTGYDLRLRMRFVVSRPRPAGDEWDL